MQRLMEAALTQSFLYMSGYWCKALAGNVHYFIVIDSQTVALLLNK